MRITVLASILSCACCALSTYAGASRAADAPAALPAPAAAVPDQPEPERGALKMAFSFKGGGGDCQMALTRDSVGVLALDPSAGALEPDDEGDGFEHAIKKRALTAGERDTADMLMGMTRAFKGNKRFACPRDDGYAFSLWSDSLTLHCSNCFSCTEGISVPEARMLARFGKLSLWLYRIKGQLVPDKAP